VKTPGGGSIEVRGGGIVRINVAWETRERPNRSKPEMNLFRGGGKRCPGDTHLVGRFQHIRVETTVSCVRIKKTEEKGILFGQAFEDQVGCNGKKTKVTNSLGNIA